MFDMEKRTFVVKSYYKSESLVTVRRAFKKRFNTRKLPINISNYQNVWKNWCRMSHAS